MDTGMASPNKRTVGDVGHKSSAQGSDNTHSGSGEAVLSFSVNLQTHFLTVNCTAHAQLLGGDGTRPMARLCQMGMC